MVQTQTYISIFMVDTPYLHSDCFPQFLLLRQPSILRQEDFGSIGWRNLERSRVGRGAVSCSRGKISDLGSSESRYS